MLSVQKRFACFDRVTGDCVCIDDLPLQGYLARRDPNTSQNRHADLGFDPSGPQRYSLSSDEAALLAPLLAAAPKDIFIDIVTRGWGAAPTFGDLYVGNVQWREYLRGNAEGKKPAESRRPRKN
jgi:hypothetical protein